LKKAKRMSAKQRCGLLLVASWTFLLLAGPAHGQYRLYWGDVHGHTSISDGKGSLDDYFTFARDVAKLASGEKSLLGDDYPPNAPLVAVLREGDIWKPIIAAVNGICSSGGLEMLQGTDIRIAAEHATFSIAEPKRGLFPGGGSTVRLPRQIPFVRAMEILFTCDFISAQQAYEIGLINRVVPKEQLMPTAMAIAERICENAPLAIQAVKRSVRQCMNLTMDEALKLELQIAAEVFMTEDAKEGPLAFAEKRKPIWKGR